MEWGGIFPSSKLGPKPPVLFSWKPAPPPQRGWPAPATCGKRIHQAVPPVTHQLPVGLERSGLGLNPLDSIMSSPRVPRSPSMRAEG